MRATNRLAPRFTPSSRHWQPPARPNAHLCRDASSRFLFGSRPPSNTRTGSTPASRISCTRHMQYCTYLRSVGKVERANGTGVAVARTWEGGVGASRGGGDGKMAHCCPHLQIFPIRRARYHNPANAFSVRFAASTRAKRGARRCTPLGRKALDHLHGARVAALVEQAVRVHRGPLARVLSQV